MQRIRLERENILEQQDWEHPGTTRLGTSENTKTQNILEQQDRWDA